MDTVILAGGRGSRLEGIMPPYMKPLMIVSGKPLINRLVDHAHEATNGGRVIIVCAPENASHIANVLQYRERRDADIDMIVQPTPRGPGDALSRGLRIASTQDVLVLMGDNVMPYNDIRKMTNAIKQNVVGTALITRREAQGHLTIIQNDQWLEKVQFDAGTDMTRTVVAWVGPLMVNKNDMAKAIHRWKNQEGGEIPIGPLLNWLPNLGMIECEAIDIGIPEAL